MLKNIVSKVKNEGFKTPFVKAAVLVVSIAAATSAHAALPAWATSMYTEAQTVIADVFAAIGPVIGAALVGFLIIRLIKRGTNKI